MKELRDKLSGLNLVKYIQTRLQRRPENLNFLEYLQSRILIKYNHWKKPKIVKIKDISLPVLEEFPRGIKDALYAGFYEKPELIMVDNKLESNDVVMELGTGLGLISSYCAKKIGNDKVFTYEANPALEPIIHNTYALNKVKPNLQILLLGEKAGEQEFWISKSFWSSSTMRLNKNYRPVKVLVKSFNEEILKINPSFLIIDIEGGEYELFQYANFHNIKKIAMELHENQLGKEKSEFVKSKLTEAGFELDLKISLGAKELFWQRK